MRALGHVRRHVTFVHAFAVVTFRRISVDLDFWWEEGVVADGHVMADAHHAKVLALPESLLKFHWYGPSYHPLCEIQVVALGNLQVAEFGPGVWVCAVGNDGGVHVT